MRLRRSPHVVCYWKNGSFVVLNYATQKWIPAQTLTTLVLEYCDEWRTPDEIEAHWPETDRALVAYEWQELAKKGVLIRSTRRATADRMMEQWGAWNPEAGFFHNATRDVPFSDFNTSKQGHIEHVATEPPPVPVKSYPDAPRISLPKPLRSGEFPEVLTTRRTWRRFHDTAVEQEALATLLQLTAGVQRWEEAITGESVPLKTSPSGGARHPIEVYVLALRVAGVEPGLYHYASDQHVLEALKTGDGWDVERYLPHQEWYQAAGALFFFAGVFERAQWRYAYARAYRAVLIEAGHLCQTLLLSATWLGLAPFCSMALADSAVEADLGLDGIRESVLYAAGVGTRPPGVDWAPWPADA